MPLNETQAWLIAYDIADPGRLAQVHKCVSAAAFPVQFSLYVGLGSQNQMNALCRRIEKLIDPVVDDVRIYRIPDSPDYFVCGEPRLECGIVLPDSIAPGARQLIAQLFRPGSAKGAPQRSGEQAYPAAGTLGAGAPKM